MTADRVTYRAHVAPSTPAVAPVAIVTPDDVPDTDGNAYLSLARKELAAAYHWLSLACDGRADWHETFDAHREQVYQALTAIEAELEVLP